jgi:hypothetical protein
MPSLRRAKPAKQSIVNEAGQVEGRETGVDLVKREEKAA